MSSPRPTSARLVALLLAVAAAGCGHGSNAGPPTAGPPHNETSGKDVKIGRCAKIDELAETKAVGFDYAELPVRDLAKLSDEDFAKALARWKEVGISTPVANVFLPNEVKVVGPGVDSDAVLAYAKKAFERMQQFGVKVIVFGSGGARKVPDGFSKDEAWKQLVDIARKLAPEAKAHDIILAVEPLRSQETNIVNTAAEGLRWVKEVDHPNFQLMVDFYHLASEKENADIIVDARNYIRHFHIANPNERVFPMDAGEYDYAPFFAALKKAGYHGTISVEARTKNFAVDGPRALAFLRSQLGKGEAPVASAGK